MFHQERGAPPAAPVPKARAKDSGVPPPPPPAASSSLSRATDTRPQVASQFSRGPSHGGDGAVSTAAEPVRHAASASEEPTGQLELLEEHSADSSFFAEEGRTLPHVPQPMSRTASENEDPPVPRQTALQFSLRAAAETQSGPAPLPPSPTTPVRTPPSLGLAADFPAE
ncbi:SKOR, partial [Symbiodinium sp. CCMP2456]